MSIQDGQLWFSEKQALTCKVRCCAECVWRKSTTFCFAYTLGYFTCMLVAVGQHVNPDGLYDQPNHCLHPVPWKRCSTHS